MSRINQILTLTVLALTAGLSARAENSVIVSEYERLATNMIRNATFMEVTPEFTDLYIIETQDKGREIVIYCNSAYCYKHRGQVVVV